MTTPIQVVKSYTATTTIAATGAGGGKSSLIVCINSFAGSSPTVTSVKLGTTALTQITKEEGSSAGSFVSVYMYALSDIPAGQVSVIITESGLNLVSGNGGVVIYEIPGTISVDKIATPVFNSGSPWSGNASGALSQPTEFVVASANGAFPFTQSGWTNASVNGTDVFSTGYKNVTDGSSQTYSGTQSTAFLYSAILASFEVTIPVNPAAFMSFLV